MIVFVDLVTSYVQYMNICTGLYMASDKYFHSKVLLRTYIITQKLHNFNYVISLHAYVHTTYVCVSFCVVQLFTYYWLYSRLEKVMFSDCECVFVTK